MMSFAQSTIRFKAEDLLAVGILGLLLMPARVSAQPLACQYKVAHVIQAPDGAFGFASPTIAMSISPNGRYVVGFFIPGAIGFNRAFAYDTLKEQFIVLPLPAGGYQSSCNDVNDSGLGVGSYWVNGGVAPQRGFVYDISAGQYMAELMPHRGASWCAVNAINAKSQVCGFRSIGSKGDTVNPFTAFIWSAESGFTDLGVMTGPSTSATDIADDGRTVGWVGTSLSGASSRAFIWHDGSAVVLPPVPGGVSSAAVAIAENGDVAVRGSMQDAPGPSRSFLYSMGGYIDIGILPGFDSAFPDDLNGGALTGGLRNLSGGIDHGFIWQAGVMRDINVLLDQHDLFGVHEGGGIAQDGTLVAVGGNLDGEILSLILEPIIVVGDADPDCTVNVDDLIAVILQWADQHSPADVTQDGTVDVEDLILVIDSWTFE